MAKLLSVDEALSQILPAFSPTPPEAIHLMAALGRILAEDIYAPVNLPPFANSSMDGFALHAADSASASYDTPVTLNVSMDIPAGTAPTQLLKPGHAARIMTGAPLPPGADAVIPVEQTDASWQNDATTPPPAQVTLYEAVNTGDYVRPAGEDVTNGQTVLQANTRLRPQDIGMLAALGISQLQVRQKPKVAILSTGDELLTVDAPLTPGKIRDVNSYTLSALTQEAGCIPHILPIVRDTIPDVRQLFRDALALQPDVIISSAGVSLGTYDVVRNVIAELGAVQFWRVNVRPGKPLAFGQVQGVQFFGLPGNPVSAMVTFDLFVRPALLAMLNQPDTVQTIMAEVTTDIKSDGRRSYLRVTLHYENKKAIAHLTGTQSSGALLSMVMADGLLVIPEGITTVTAGTKLPVRLLR